MRILISLFIVLFLTSCETTPNKELSVSQLPKETIEKPDKANIYFVRPMNPSLMWYSYTAFIGVGNESVGGLQINSKGKVFVDPGVYKIVASSNVDKVTQLLTSDQTFTSRFQKGKNYYFEIKPSLTKIFFPKPISRKRYLQLSQKLNNNDSFVKVLKTIQKPMEQIIKSKKERDRAKKEAKKIEELNKKTEEMNKDNETLRGATCKLSEDITPARFCIYKCSNGETHEELATRSSVPVSGGGHMVTYKCDRTIKLSRRIPKPR